MKYSQLITITLLIVPFLVSSQNQADTITAKTYFVTADSLSQLSEYELAATNFQKAGEIYLGLEIWDKYAASLNKLSECSWRMYDIEAADSYVNKALLVCENNLPDDHPQLANCFNNQGIIYFFTGQLTEANVALKKALALRKRVLNEDDPDLAFTLNSLGALNSKTRDFDIAMDYYQQALIIKKKVYGLDHQEVAKTIINIGALQMETQNSGDAIESFLSGLAIYKKIFGNSHPELISVFAGLGFGYTFSGDFQKGRDYFLKAIENTSKFLGENHPLMGNHFNGMAVNHTERKEFPQALEYYFKAISIYESSPIVDYQLIAIVQSNIGTTYLKLEDYQNATHHLNKALSIHNEFDIDDKATSALIYDLLGDVYSGLNDYQEALKQYSEGLRIRSEILGKSNIQLAVSNYSLATALAAQEKYEEALRYCQKALIINTLNFSDTSTYINPPITEIQNEEVFLSALQMKAQILTGMYTKSGQLSDLEFSLSTHQLCDQLMIKMRQSHNRYDDKVRLGETFVRTYAGAISVSKELAKIKGDKSYESLAFDFAEKSRAAALMANKSDNEAKRFSGLPDTLLWQEQALKSSQSYYRTVLLDMRADQNGYDTIKFNRYQNILISANLKLDSLTLFFEKNHKKYYQLKYQNAAMKKDEVQNNLAPNQALIEYFEDIENMYVFALTKDEFQMKTFVKDSFFIEALDQYISAFDPAQAQGEFQQSFPAFCESSFTLYQALLAPIIEDLPSSINHIVFVPTENMAYIPMELLITEMVDSSEQNDYKSLEYFFKDYSVSYAYSASLFLKEDKTSAVTTTGSVLAFAPTYQTESINYANLRSSFRDQLLPLKWNTAEIKEIDQYFDGTFKRGSEATEANFKNSAKNHSILHLAMHAFVDDEDPMQSKLLFFQDNDSIEDGMLHTYELFNMDLSAEMVVLSACKTGLGKVQEGEGMMSLGRAFAYAGCPSIVSSYWSVDDQSTSKLMASFYKYIADGLSKDKALQLAKLDFLANTNGPKTHPYYWGGFVVLGDTKPISGRTNLPFIFLAVFMIMIPLVIWWQYQKNPKPA